MTAEDMVLKLIEKGLRAQLRTAILLTGQLYVSLTMAAASSSKPISYASGYPVIPVISGPTEEILARVTQFLSRLEALPIEQIGEDLQASLKDIRFLVSSRDLPAALAALRKSLDQIKRFAGTLNTDTAPQLASRAEWGHPGFEPDPGHHGGRGGPAGIRCAIDL